MNEPRKQPPSTPPTTARDREMGRDAPQSGDLGQVRITWAPPPGEPGISNRPDDDGDTGDDARTDKD